MIARNSESVVVKSARANRRVQALRGPESASLPTHVSRVVARKMGKGNRSNAAKCAV